jgi:hypothetical protein
MAKIIHPWNTTKKLQPSPLAYWLALIATCSIIIAFVYVAIQQDYRTSANDPQIQMAEDGAAALANGASPASLVTGQKVNMAASLAPFTIVVDKNLRVLASNGQLNGQTVLPPRDVFSNAKSNGELRFTWQTAGGYRFATVVDLSSSGDFVISARSLTEVEKQENALTFMAMATLIGLVVVILFIAFVVK